MQGFFFLIITLFGKNPYILGDFFSCYVPIFGENVQNGGFLLKKRQECDIIRRKNVFIVIYIIIIIGGAV